MLDSAHRCPVCGAAPSSLRLLEIFRKRTAPIFSSRQFGGFFKTHRGTLSNKSDLGDQGRRFVPELSSPFQMRSARVNDRATETKKVQAMKLQKLIHVLMPIACIALLPQISALSPQPDGCYPNFTTAEGCKALRSLTAGAANTGIGWYSLSTTTTGSSNTAVGAGALDLNNAHTIRLLV